MTRTELNDFLESLYAPLHERRQREQERQQQQPVAQARNLTDAEMARWREHFYDLVAQERAAMQAHVTSEREAERDFIMEVVAGVLAEIRHEIEDKNQQSIDAALATVQTKLESLHAEIMKHVAIERGTIIELPNVLDRKPAA